MRSKRSFDNYAITCNASCEVSVREAGTPALAEVLLSDLIRAAGPPGLRANQGSFVEAIASVCNHAPKVMSAFDSVLHGPNLTREQRDVAKEIWRSAHQSWDAID